MSILTVSGLNLKEDNGTENAEGIPALECSFKPLDIQRVLLLYPFAVTRSYNLEAVLRDGQFAEAPIGLGYISAYVKSHLPEITVEVFDANVMAINHIKETRRCDMEELWQLLKKKVVEYQPNVVGISCLFHSTAFVAHQTCAAIKEVSKSIITVMGGNYPTGSPETALSDRTLDFVIFSEGEESFTGLLKSLRTGQEPSRIVEGITYLNETIERISAVAPSVKPSEEKVQTPKQTMIKSLEDIPYPDRSNFDMEFYSIHTRHFAFRTLKREDVRLATMTASRGCPFKCTFCSAKDFWGMQIRYRDPKVVVDEMEYLVDEYGINTFVFNDDNIMFNRREILRLCDEIKRRNLNINWLSGGGIQVTAMKPDVIQALVETGLKQFNLAIETGNPQTLRRIKKPLVQGIAEEVIENIRKYEGTWIGSNFITGFYFETLDDIHQTLEYAGSLGLDWRSIYSFQPLPGTEDYKECVARGYLPEWSIWEKGNQGELIELSTENFKAEDVRHLNYLANLRYNFLENRNLNVLPTRALGDFNYVIEMVPDHAIGHYGSGMAYKNLSEYGKALESFECAREIVEQSKQIDHSVFKSNLAMTSANVRWVDCFDYFDIDVESHIHEVGETLAKSKGLVACPVLA